MPRLPQLCLCLSRACLGKRSVLGIKWRKNSVFLSHLYIKTNILPRQARDKHRETSEKGQVYPPYRPSSMSIITCRNVSLSFFVSDFPYVCPEPVLTNTRFLVVMKWRNKRRSPHQRRVRWRPRRGAVSTTGSCRKQLFFAFSLCLSRACLGKMMHFIYKWRKKWKRINVILGVHTLVS